MQTISLGRVSDYQIPQAHCTDRSELIQVWKNTRNKLIDRVLSSKGIITTIPASRIINPLNPNEQKGTNSFVPLQNKKAFKKTFVLVKMIDFVHIRCFHCNKDE